MEKLKCVAHYTSPDYEYSNLTVLSENAHSRLVEARQIRVNWMATMNIKSSVILSLNMLIRLSMAFT